MSSSWLATNPNGGAPPIWAVDATLNWADPLKEGKQFKPYFGPIPACVHLHGGEVPSAFDGGPDAWFTADENGDGQPDYTGPGFVTDTYSYPNASEAATGWFHDHGLGVTRLNPFAGLAAFYLLRDPANEAANLPGGNQEIEIAIQDRLFDTNGQPIFPANGINPTIHPFWIPEFQSVMGPVLSTQEKRSTSDRPPCQKLGVSMRIRAFGTAPGIWNLQEWLPVHPCAN